MKGSFSIILFCVFALVSCAQTKSVIKQSHAFYVVRLPGIIAVDENGNPRTTNIDTLNIIYVETTTKNLVWGEAERGGAKYAVQATLVTANQFMAGINKTTQEPVVLKTADSNQLWRLLLVQNDKAEYKGTNKAEPFIITGRNGDKKFSLTIKNQQELILPDQAQ